MCAKIGGSNTYCLHLRKNENKWRSVLLVWTLIVDKYWYIASTDIPIDEAEDSRKPLQMAGSIPGTQLWKPPARYLSVLKGTHIFIDLDICLFLLSFFLVCLRFSSFVPQLWETFGLKLDKWPEQNSERSNIFMSKTQRILIWTYTKGLSHVLAVGLVGFRKLLNRISTSITFSLLT